MRVVTQASVDKVLVYQREEHTYVFIFNEQTKTQAFRMMGRFAVDPKLSFTWFDAAKASRKIREFEKGQYD